MSQANDSFEVTYPNQVFLVIVANVRTEKEATKPRNYEFTFKFTDLDGEFILAEQKRIEEKEAEEAAASENES